MSRKNRDASINVQMVEHLGVTYINGLARRMASSTAPKTVGAGGVYAYNASKPLVGALLRGIA